MQTSAARDSHGMSSQPYVIMEKGLPRRSSESLAVHPVWSLEREVHISVDPAATIFRKFRCTVTARVSWSHLAINSN